MKVWWLALSERDRRLGLLALLGMVGLLVWLGMWRPIDSSRSQWVDRTQRATGELVWMQQASVQAAQLRGPDGQGSVARSRGNLSLLALVEQTARTGGLGQAFRRGEASGNDQLRVWFENAPFESLLGWLTILENDYAVSVDDAALDRTGTGTVDARLLLVER